MALAGIPHQLPTGRGTGHQPATGAPSHGQKMAAMTPLVMQPFCLPGLTLPRIWAESGHLGQQAPGPRPGEAATGTPAVTTS